MRRGTTKAKTDALLDKMREKVPGITIRTTLIAGYPGETQEDHQVVLDWVQQQRFDRLGVFAYSHEENTHAFNLEDNVPAEVKQQRVDEIMALQMEISRAHNEKKVGQEFRVLVDRKEGSHFVARTEFDSPDVDNEVLIPAEDIYLKIGDFCTVKIVEAHDYDLIGQVID
jgi:ribosomal protein S12 methylthiotransferase